MQYSEDATLRATDWHAHATDLVVTQNGKRIPGAAFFGEAPRSGAGPYRYATKPMVAVSWGMANDLARQLGPGVDLPTEAQWERAARGGPEGCRYPWGDAPPTPERCDFDNFRGFCLRPSRSLPPNGYGLYNLCGGVWEWCRDHYLADWYSRHRHNDPLCTLGGAEARRVLRGGSWADCAEAVTVSFRMARVEGHWRERGRDGCPNIGFRLVRASPPAGGGSVGRPVSGG